MREPRISAHEYYGYGTMIPGEEIRIPVDKADLRGDDIYRVQTRIHTYARGARKKFGTEKDGDFLCVWRIK